MYTQSNVIRKIEGRVPAAAIALALVGDTPSSLRSLFAGQAVEAIEPGEALFWQGDTAGHVFEIVSGALRTVRVLSDGRRVITGFLFPGDIAGLSLKDRYLTTVEAIAPTRLRRLARRRFEAEVERLPALRPQLMERLCDEMAAAQDQVMLLARKTAEEKVASFLLALARRAGTDCDAVPVVALPMTRLDMADYLGLTIETVSRIMTRLTSRGVIAAAGRHAVSIRRPAALAALAVDDQDDEGADYRARHAN